MSKPKQIPTLREYLQEHAPQISTEDAKIIINAYDSYLYDTKGFYCDICYKKLTDEEILSISNDDYIITCTRHRKYKNYFQVHLVRKQLNIRQLDLLSL